MALEIRGKDDSRHNDVYYQSYANTTNEQVVSGQPRKLLACYEPGFYARDKISGQRGLRFPRKACRTSREMLSPITSVGTAVRLTRSRPFRAFFFLPTALLASSGR
jgi:hypothetical protein